MQERNHLYRNTNQHHLLQEPNRYNGSNGSNRGVGVGAGAGGGFLNVTFITQDRAASVDFFTRVLGMSVLRHNEFPSVAPGIATSLPTPPLLPFNSHTSLRSSSHQDVCMNSGILHTSNQILGERESQGESVSFAAARAPLLNINVGVSTSDCASRFSQTVFGYGPEEYNLSVVAEYHYGMRDFGLNDDDQRKQRDSGWITVRQRGAIDRLVASGSIWEPLQSRQFGRGAAVRCPDGNIFRVFDAQNLPSSAEGEMDTTDRDWGRVEEVGLHVASLDDSLDYWSELLGMAIITRGGTKALFRYGRGGCRIALYEASHRLCLHPQRKQLKRLTFGCSARQMERMYRESLSSNEPAAQSVVKGRGLRLKVLLLRDPDFHELLFADQAVYARLLSRDNRAGQNLSISLASEKSSEILGSIFQKF